MENANSDGKSLIVQQIAIDAQFIQRNILDLSKTAQFSHMSELEELHQMAYKNLKKQLEEGKPLAEDPALALEAYKTLSGVVMQVVETKRKAADTLLKARSLIDVPRGTTGILEEEDDLPDDDAPGNSASGNSFFERLSDNQDDNEGKDPSMEMAI